MACKGFEKRLMEEALRTTDPALLTHLAVCAECRAELAAQCELQTRINAGIEAMVAGEPSPALLTRVRAQLAAQETPESRYWMQWAWRVAAVAALVGLAIFVAERPAFRHPSTQTAHQSAQNPSAPPKSDGAPTQLIAKAATANAAATAPVRHNSRANQASRQVKVEVARQNGKAEAVEVSVQVIVPAGQSEAVARLVQALRSGRVDAASLVTPGQPGDLTPLAIAPLELKPANRADGDKTGGSGSDLRNEF